MSGTAQQELRNDISYGVAPDTVDQASRAWLQLLGHIMVSVSLLYSLKSLATRAWAVMIYCKTTMCPVSLSRVIRCCRWWQGTGDDAALIDQLLTAAEAAAASVNAAADNPVRPGQWPCVTQSGASVAPLHRARKLVTYRGLSHPGRPCW